MGRKYFISYRRADNPDTATRLLSALTQQFPDDEFILDIHALIQTGENFARTIRRVVPTCTGVIALIGPQWITLFKPEDDEDPDWVAVELETALDCGLPILPVTIHGGQAPKRSDLPEALKPIADLTATDLRFVQFDHDFKLLVADLEESRSAAPSQPEEPEAGTVPKPTTGGSDGNEPDPPPERPFKLISVLAAVAAIVATGLWIVFSPGESRAECIERLTQSGTNSMEAIFTCDAKF